jgi:hypothetical protein
MNVPKMTISKHLPEKAAALLAAAARVEITAKNPLARIEAIDSATNRIMKEFPSFFKSESNCETQI